jgi:hypothetical protein
LYGFSSKPPVKFNSLTKDVKSKRISYSSTLIWCSEVAGSRYFPSGAEKLKIGVQTISILLQLIFLLLFLGIKDELR